MNKLLTTVSDKTDIGSVGASTVGGTLDVLNGGSSVTDMLNLGTSQLGFPDVPPPDPFGVNPPDPFVDNLAVLPVNEPNQLLTPLESISNNNNNEQTTSASQYGPNTDLTNTDASVLSGQPYTDAPVTPTESSTYDSSSTSSITQTSNAQYGNNAPAITPENNAYDGSETSATGIATSSTIRGQTTTTNQYRPNTEPTKQNLMPIVRKNRLKIERTILKNTKYIDTPITDSNLSPGDILAIIRRRMSISTPSATGVPLRFPTPKRSNGVNELLQRASALNGESNGVNELLQRASALTEGRNGVDDLLQRASNLDVYEQNVTPDVTSDNQMPLVVKRLITKTVTTRKQVPAANGNGNGAFNSPPPPRTVVLDREIQRRIQLLQQQLQQQQIQQELQRRQQLLNGRHYMTNGVRISTASELDNILRTAGNPVNNQQDPLNGNGISSRDQVSSNEENRQLVVNKDNIYLYSASEPTRTAQQSANIARQIPVNIPPIPVSPQNSKNMREAAFRVASSARPQVNVRKPQMNSRKTLDNVNNANMVESNTGLTVPRKRSALTRDNRISANNGHGSVAEEPHNLFLLSQNDNGKHFADLKRLSMKQPLQRGFIAITNDNRGERILPVSEIINNKRVRDIASKLQLNSAADIRAMNILFASNINANMQPTSQQQQSDQQKTETPVTSSKDNEPFSFPIGKITPPDVSNNVGRISSTGMVITGTQNNVETARANQITPRSKFDINSLLSESELRRVMLQMTVLSARHSQSICSRGKSLGCTASDGYNSHLWCLNHCLKSSANPSKCRNARCQCACVYSDISTSSAFDNTITGSGDKPYVHVHSHGNMGQHLHTRNIHKSNELTSQLSQKTNAVTNQVYSTNTMTNQRRPPTNSLTNKRPAKKTFTNQRRPTYTLTNQRPATNTLNNKITPTGEYTCIASKAFKEVPGMNEWCKITCKSKGPNCPSSQCDCGYH